MRIRIQRQFSIDDYILLFGALTLTASLILLQGFYVDTVYMIQYMQFGDGKLGLPLNWLARIYNYQITGYLAYTLSFCTIISIKFCFLFLFKGLISRIRWLVVYWWFVFVFTAVVSVWGLVLYWVVCPYYNSIDSREYSYRSSGLSERLDLTSLQSNAEPATTSSTLSESPSPEWRWTSSATSSVSTPFPFIPQTPFH